MAEIDVRRWNGSLVTSLDPDQLTPGDFSDLDNFIYDRNGLPTVRGGRRLWTDGNQFSFNFHSMYHYRSSWMESRARDFLLAFRDGSVDAFESGTSYATILGATLSSGFHLATWATLRGWAILGIDDPYYPRPMFWDGNLTKQMAPLLGAPEGFIVASHASRLWVVDRHEPSTLWYSEPFEPNGWKASGGAGRLFVEAGDGNTISALIPNYAGEMIIGKDGPNGGATYRLQGNSTLNFAIVPVSKTLGPMSSRAAQQVGDRDVFFASRRGLHSLRRTIDFGDLEAAFIDAEVSNVWRDLPDEQKRHALAVDDFTRDTWWLWYDSDLDGLNDRGILFNYRHNGPRGNPKVSACTFGADAAATFRNPYSGDNWLLTSGSGLGISAEHGPQPSDDTSETAFQDYAWLATLHPIDAGQGMRMKCWNTLWLRYDQWGDAEMFVSHWGDNRPPSTQAISLNPDGLATPASGDLHGGEFRGSQDAIATSCVHLREGGRALNLALSGTGCRTTLRGFQLEFDLGRKDVTAGTWLPYWRSRDGLRVG